MEAWDWKNKAEIMIACIGFFVAKSDVNSLLFPKGFICMVKRLVFQALVRVPPVVCHKGRSGT